MTDDTTPPTADSASARTDGGTDVLFGSADADDTRPDDADPSEDGSDVPAGTATDAATFRAEDLVVGYPGAEEPVIDGETVRVEPGAVTALVGPNGSGKSTLLKGLADQLPLDAGRVLLDGREVHGMESKELARRLGLLSQENVSPDSVPVEKLVEHGRYPHRGFLDGLDAEDREAIDRAIELAGVDHLRGRKVGSLSGGQKQLVWIAMVLAQETDVLLLDEPTTFLDMHHQLEVMEVIETLRDEGEVTVAVVLHDVEQAARHADHLIALKEGAVHAHGPPEEVVTERLLAEVFGVEARVTPSEHGPRVDPLRPHHDG